MTVIPFLNNRQLGSKTRTGSRLCHFNFDNVLSRLVCYKKDIFAIRGEEGDVPPFACKFKKDTQNNLLAVANEDGDISLYDSSEIAQKALLNSFAAHHNAIFDVCWVPNQCYLISGSGDHNAVLWDLTYCKYISIFRNHTASVKTVDVCHEQSAIFATGSRDGNINIWDIREKNSTIHDKPSISICQAHCRKSIVVSGKRMGQKDPISSISSVAFQDYNNLASAGVADGVLKIWDLRKSYVLNSKYLPSPKYKMSYSESRNIGHGCTSIVFDSLYKNLYACSTNNKILKFDCHSYAKGAVASYEGFRCATYFVKLALSGDDQYLLCGSSNDKAYIWKIEKPGLPILQLPGHSAEVTSVSWSPNDITKLATCGDDNKVIIWKISNSETVSNIDDVHAVIEPFFECSKNGIIPSGKTDRNKQSPIESLPTPSKSAPRFITTFFTPVASSPTQLLPKDIQNKNTSNSNDALSTANKLPNKSSTAEASSQILTPSKHVNKDNIKHQSPNEILGKQTTPVDKNSSPDNRNAGAGFFSPPSIQNKENASTDLSPESVNETNTDQVKRKSTTHSTPNLKRKQTYNSNKSKRPTKVAKKPVAGRTIMNYFPVVSSPDS